MDHLNVLYPEAQPNGPIAPEVIFLKSLLNTYFTRMVACTSATNITFKTSTKFEVHNITPKMGRVSVKDFTCSSLGEPNVTENDIDSIMHLVGNSLYYLRILLECEGSSISDKCQKFSAKFFNALFSMEGKHRPWLNEYFSTYRSRGLYAHILSHADTGIEFVSRLKPEELSVHYDKRFLSFDSESGLVFSSCPAARFALDHCLSSMYYAYTVELERILNSGRLISSYARTRHVESIIHQVFWNRGGPLLRNGFWRLTLFDGQVIVSPKTEVTTLSKLHNYLEYLDYFRADVYVPIIPISGHFPAVDLLLYNSYQSSFILFQATVDNEDDDFEKCLIDPEKREGHKYYVFHFRSLHFISRFIFMNV